MKRSGLVFNNTSKHARRIQNGGTKSAVSCKHQPWDCFSGRESMVTTQGDI